MPNPVNPGGLNPNLPNVINPGDPWVHVEKVSFRPTEILNSVRAHRDMGWPGTRAHHHPHLSEELCQYVLAQWRDQGWPRRSGARFGAFDFSYRLPFVRKWLTLYADSEVHDDVSPADAPRRAAYRPGLYLSHVPGVPRLDLRVEAASTDPSNSTVAARQHGQFMYWEGIQKQGYTNQGQLFGDWIGREDRAAKPGLPGT